MSLRKNMKKRFQVSGLRFQGEKGRNRGMTLVEMLAVLAVASLVLIVISNSILSLHKTNGAGLQTIAEVASARAGMAALTQNLREAAYGDDGSYPIASMGTSSIVFFSAIPNGNGAQKIGYILSEGALLKGILSAGTPPTYSGAAATSSIAEHVSNAADNTPMFRYYDSGGTEITDMSKVRDVRSVVVTVNVFTGGVNPSFTLTSRITPRILKSL
jgi:prepilin-type N-terminal cleavage/methylation domain-containing protein